MNRELKRNFLYAMIAQVVVLGVGVMTNLILPRIISPSDFSYWQLFIFYAQYIPCLALGLNDGVYLRYGGEYKAKVNWGEIKNQFVFGLIFQSILVVLIGALTAGYVDDGGRKMVMGFTLIYFLIFTAHNFLGYIFQAINETDKNSKSIIIGKTIYFLSQVALVACGINNVFKYIPMYIIGYVLALIYLMFFTIPLFRNSSFNLHDGVCEGLKSIKIGSSLMISNVCSMLVLGISRQVLDMHWGLFEFGMISFTLTLINFALSFMTQIGMVLFPVLRRMEQSNLRDTYERMLTYIGMTLPLVYLLFFPIRSILSLWLPNYTQSFYYLGILLPICYFDAKMQLISNTFFKVLKQQVKLLKINILSIICSLIFSMVCAYGLDSIGWLVRMMVVAIMIRSIVSDYLLSRFMDTKFLFHTLIDVVLAMVFILSANSTRVACAIGVVFFFSILRIATAKLIPYK